MMSALEESQLEENWEEVEAEVAAVSETTARSGNSVNPHLESDAETLKLGESCVTPPQKLRRTLKLDPKDIAESETPARSSSEATMIVPAGPAPESHRVPLRLGRFGQQCEVEATSAAGPYQTTLVVSVIRRRN